MKLPSVYTGLGFKTDFRKFHRRLQLTLPLRREHRQLRVASCELQLLLAVPVQNGSRSRNVTCDARFTGGRLRQLKQHSVTDENIITYWFNFYYKYLGNHLLQYCPQVMNHPVYYLI
jgi:hypothetical protein